MNKVYLASFFIALAASAVFVALARWAALRWDILDHPSTPVKTHRHATPLLGGVGIFLGIVTALVAVRFLTSFPTGTLRSLWAILLGGAFLLGVGLVDDAMKPRGISFEWKFLFQFLAAAILIFFDIRIRFIEPDWIADVATLVWVAGITNAFNIIDIMDGLSASQVVVAALGFLFISIPTEQVYVNVAAAAAAGAALAFLPFNFSSRRKIFMGDAGSLMLGFVMSALSLGTNYTHVSEVGLLAPILILGLPIYDTFFVSALRLKQGKSPFLGSKDHLALKLRALGYSPRRVVTALGTAAAAFSALAYIVTRAGFMTAIVLAALALVIGFYVVVRLHDVKVD
jgi:UDP-GlcNAc:undecaprenyl-phosphate GlcNAc-1-phosphate transferase